MDEKCTFLAYLTTRGETQAVFTEHQEGSKFYLTKEECQSRLANLKKRGVSSIETQRALNHWPPE